MSRVAYASEDGRVIVHDLANGSERDLSVRGRRATTGDAIIIDNWPTWSPDGQRVAFIRVEVAGGDVRRAGVWVVGSNDGSSAEVYTAGGTAPIYLAWAPDGQRLGVLDQAGNGLALRIIDPRSPQPPLTVAQGSPLYFSWGADSRTLVAHVGAPGVSSTVSSLMMVRLAGGSATRQRLSLPPAAGFRAPSWSVRHRALTLAYARGDAAEIVVQESPDGPARVLAQAGPAPAFLWSPGGDLLAFAARDPAAPGVYAGLTVVSADGGAPRRLSEEPIVAFCWTPDGAKLVCFGSGVTGRMTRMIAIDVASSTPFDLGWMRPTRDYWFMLGHFDQYASSMPLVSANSAHLALAVSHAKEAENGTVPTVRQIVARPLSGQGSDITIGRGRTVCWSPV